MEMARRPVPGFPHPRPRNAQTRGPQRLEPHPDILDSTPGRVYDCTHDGADPATSGSTTSPSKTTVVEGSSPAVRNGEPAARLLAAAEAPGQGRPGKWVARTGYRERDRADLTVTLPKLRNLTPASGLNPRDRFDRPGDSCVPLMREQRDTEGSEGSETAEWDTLRNGRFGKPGERTARYYIVVLPPLPPTPQSPPCQAVQSIRRRHGSPSQSVAPRRRPLLRRCPATEQL
jgi:hypothetical protein